MTDSEFLPSWLTIYSDHIGITNDFFSYSKERVINGDENNVVRILQQFDGMTYPQALAKTAEIIRQKERDYIVAGMAVLNDPELGKDPEVQRWIASMPYCMGGNLAWSQMVRTSPGSGYRLSQRISPLDRRPDITLEMFQGRCHSLILNGLLKKRQRTRR